MEEKGMANERLRIVLEFKKTSVEDLELYQKLLVFSNPAATIKDILKGVIPISVLDDEEFEDIE